MEKLVGGLDRSASSPDVIKEDVSGFRVNFDFGVEYVGRGGLSLAGGGVGADLDGVFGTDEEGNNVAMRAKSG